MELSLLYSRNNNNGHSNKKYTDTIFKYCGIIVPNKDTNTLYNEARYLGFDFIFDVTDGFREWSPVELKPKTFSHTFYQYYKPFEDYENIVREVFLKGLNDQINQLKNKFNFNEASTAFLHVRRGDYLKYSDTFYTIGMDYYEKAEKFY